MVASKSSSKEKAAVDPKLEALRHHMAAAEGGAGVDAYIIPSEDPHMVSTGPRPIPPMRSIPDTTVCQAIYVGCARGLAPSENCE